MNPGREGPLEPWVEKREGAIPGFPPALRPLQLQKKHLISKTSSKPRAWPTQPGSGALTLTSGPKSSTQSLLRMCAATHSTFH